MVPKGVQYTVSATAATLYAALGSPADAQRYRDITIYAANENTGPIYLGGSTVTNVPAYAWIRINPGKAYTFPPNGGHYDSLYIYIVGTASDIAHIVATPL